LTHGNLPRWGHEASLGVTAGAGRRGRRISRPNGDALVTER
jgi:hypothetical protein